MRATLRPRPPGRRNRGRRSPGPGGGASAAAAGRSIMSAGFRHGARRRAVGASRPVRAARPASPARCAAGRYRLAAGAAGGGAPGPGNAPTPRGAAGDAGPAAGEPVPLPGPVPEGTPPRARADFRHGRVSPGQAAGRNPDGTLKQLFEEEIKKSWEEYSEQVGRDVAESSSHFRDALNEILADGKSIF